ncbi:MAG: hypothetical protein ABIR08_03310 [Sphingomonas sp.]
MVAALDPLPGDHMIEFRHGQCCTLLPIEKYGEVTEFAKSLASEFSHPLHIVPVSPSDLLNSPLHGPRLENGLATMTDQQRGELRRCVVNGMCEVMRDCPDEQVRREAYDVLKTMKVIRP